MEDNNMHRIVYLIALKIFFEKNGYKENDKDAFKLLPPKWSFIDYKTRTNILNEAIENNTSIDKTKGYLTLK